MTINKFNILLATIMATLLVACNNNDEPANAIPSDICYDFATLESIKDGSTFTLRKSADSELVTYFSSYKFPESAGTYVGDRMIIMYLPANGTPYTTGQITLYGYRKLDNPIQIVVRTDAAECNVRTSDDIKVLSLARTGEYINLQANFQCFNATKPKKLILAVDSLKMDVEYPELSIIYEAQQDGMNYYGGYASFDISDIWNRPTCKGIIINYMTGNGESSSTFKKGESFLPVE